MRLFFDPRRASMPSYLESSICKMSHLLSFLYLHWKSQVDILSRLGGDLRTSRPSKNQKIVHISRPEVTTYLWKISDKVQINIYQIWKFGENRSSRFWEIACTKSVRKIIIIIGKKKPNENNKVFRWRRKTLIIIIIIRNRVKTICSQTPFGEHNNN